MADDETFLSQVLNEKSSLKDLIPALANPKASMDLKGRPQSTNVDHRHGGSPDERDQRHLEDDYYAANVYLQLLRDSRLPPGPLSDPRKPMPGGELGIGQGMSRQDFWQQNAEQVWVNKAGNDLTTKHYRTKFLGLFPLSPSEYLNGGGSSTWKTTGSKAPAEFLLDTYKRARSVGLPIHPINAQPEPLPSTFKKSK